METGKQVNKDPRSGAIRKKLLRVMVGMVVVTLVASFVVSQVSMAIVRKSSKKQLVEQALSSAESYAEGQAESINNLIEGIAAQIDQAARYAEELYQHPEYSDGRVVLLPDDFPDTTTGLTIHWLPYAKAQASDPSIHAEANLLSGLEPEFHSIMQTSDLILSLYLATNTNVNIGYDEAVLLKKGIGEYDPVSLGKDWFNVTMEKQVRYISDTYVDQFGRGLEVTIASPFFVDGKVRGVIGADIVIETINASILDLDLGEGGRAMLFSADSKPISAEEMIENPDVTAAELLGSETIASKLTYKQSDILESNINGSKVYIAFDTIKTTGWKVALSLSYDSIVAPAEETGKQILKLMISVFVLDVILLAVILAFANKKCKDLTQPLALLTKEVIKIGNGNLEYVHKIKTGDEVAMLSEAFESMTASLKKYIENLTAVTAEKERIGAELGVAAHIQSSMLPSIFPAFPEREEFDIYATMNPAKEVGGDFYDFFMIDERHIAIVMADVSGKGVPAALFMVIGKTLLKDHSDGRGLSEVFTEVNNLLCESNSEGLFITAFEGVLDLVTGEFNYVNAGHEMPFICKKGEAFKPYKIKPGFVLAGMEDMRFRAGSLTLEPGDKVFQYTDGVTEATDANNQLFGMERLEASLAKCADMKPHEILPTLKADIDAFVGAAPQFDDITMLCLEYKKRLEE